MLQSVYCSVLQSLCCSTLQCVAGANWRGRATLVPAMCCRVLQSAAVCCKCKCVAVRCSQCVAVRCSDEYVCHDSLTHSHM